MHFLGQIFLTLRIAGISLAMIGFGIYLIVQQDDWGLGLLSICLGIFMGGVSWYWANHRRTRTWWAAFEEALPTVGYSPLDRAELPPLRPLLAAILPDAQPSARPLLAWHKQTADLQIWCGIATPAADRLVTTIFVLVELPLLLPFRVELRTRLQHLPDRPWLKSFRIIRQSSPHWDAVLPDDVGPLLRELSNFDWNLGGKLLGCRFAGPVQADHLDAARVTEFLRHWELFAQRLTDACKT